MGRKAGAAMEIENSVPAGNEVVGVDKIRDLLFRNQIQDYDRRCADMQQRLARPRRAFGYCRDSSTENSPLRMRWPRLSA